MDVASVTLSVECRSKLFVMRHLSRKPVCAYIGDESSRSVCGAAPVGFSLRGLFVCGQGW